MTKAVITSNPSESLRFRTLNQGTHVRGNTETKYLSKHTIEGIRSVKVVVVGLMISSSEVKDEFALQSLQLERVAVSEALFHRLQCTCRLRNDALT